MSFKQKGFFSPPPPRRKVILLVSDGQLRGLELEGATVGRLAMIPLDRRGPGPEDPEYEVWDPSEEEAGDVMSAPYNEGTHHFMQLSFDGWAPDLDGFGGEQQRWLEDVLEDVLPSRVDEVWLALGANQLFRQGQEVLPPDWDMDVAGRVAKGIARTIDRLGDLFPFAEVVYLGMGKTLEGELAGPESGTPEGRAEMNDIAELVFSLVKNGMQNRAEAEEARGPIRPPRCTAYHAFAGWKNEHVRDVLGNLTRAGLQKFLENLRHGPGKGAL